MLLLPANSVALLSPFAPLFSRPVWRHVQVLLVGALLAPGRRMVRTVLRAVGLRHLPTFQTYHRVLNRAVWSSLGASRILLQLLVATFAPEGPLVVGIDETTPRRRGAKIAAAGMYRDPVRSSRSHVVKVRGLRWICATLLVPIPWAGRVWALPFLTVLAPSERDARRRRRVYKPLTTWARQLILQVHRWVPARRLVVVGDRAYAALELLDAVRPVATLVVRLRLDARLFAPPPPRVPGQKGRPRLVGERLPNLTAHRDTTQTVWKRLTLERWYGERERPVEILSQTAVWYSTGFPPVPIRWVLIRDPLQQFATQALLCTDVEADPQQIITWFILRWQLEVTFHEVRAHLGVETQCQWSDRAIARTTPALFGLFSLVTLLAHDQLQHLPAPPIRQAAWYAKSLPTFADALALVRRQLWTQTIFPTSPADADLVKVPRALVDHLHSLLCSAA
ncbi:MAG: IS701 family transposase [Ktedonobacterales bacterium]